MSGQSQRTDRDARHKRRSGNDASNGTPTKVKKSVEDFDYFKLGKRKADLKARFDEIDRNGNGHVSMYELEKAPEFQKELAASDLNKDNVITFDEFWKTMKNAYWPYMPEAEEVMANTIANKRMDMRRRFMDLDTNKDGKLTMGEIYNVDNALLDIFYLIDKDQNSEMTFDELWDFASEKMFTDIPEEVNLRAFFKECDTDYSGFLSYQEICDSKQYKKNEKLAKSLDAMMHMDKNEDGKVSVEEFLDNWRRINRKPKDTRKSLGYYDYFKLAEVKANVKKLFDEIDKDKSGKLSKQELRETKELSRDLKGGLADIDGDGEVTFDELWTTIRNVYYGDMMTAEEIMADYVAQARDKLWKKFNDLDKTGDGKLTMGEIYGVDNELLDIFYLIDKDQNSEMTFEELWEFTAPKMFVNIPDEVSLRVFFQECDTNNDGYLSYQEICESIYYKENEKLAKYLDAMMDMDTNKDGKVSVEEFLNNWRKMEREKVNPAPPKPAVCPKPPKAEAKPSPSKKRGGRK